MGETEEELRRLKEEKSRRDEHERALIYSSLRRIESSQAEHGVLLTATREEQRKTTKILFGDESDTKPGLVKRVDRLEGKVGLIWAAAVAGFSSVAHTAWGWITGGKA